MQWSDIQGRRNFVIKHPVATTYLLADLEWQRVIYISFSFWMSPTVHNITDALFSTFDRTCQQTSFGGISYRYFIFFWLFTYLDIYLQRHMNLKYLCVRRNKNISLIISISTWREKGTFEYWKCVLTSNLSKQTKSMFTYDNIIKVTGNYKVVATYFIFFFEWINWFDVLKMSWGFIAKLWKSLNVAHCI